MNDDRILRERLGDWDPARHHDVPDRDQVRWLRARVLAAAAEAEESASVWRRPLLAAVVAAALAVMALTLILLSSSRPAEGPAQLVRVEDSRRIGASEPFALPAGHRPPASTPPAAAVDTPSAQPPAVLEPPAQRRRLEMTGRRGTRLIWSIEPDSPGDLGVAD